MEFENFMFPIRIKIQQSLVLYFINKIYPHQTGRQRTSYPARYTSPALAVQQFNTANNIRKYFGDWTTHPITVWTFQNSNSRWSKCDSNFLYHLIMYSKWIIYRLFRNVMKLTKKLWLAVSYIKYVLSHNEFKKSLSQMFAMFEKHLKKW